MKFLDDEHDVEKVEKIKPYQVDEYTQTFLEKNNSANTRRKKYSALRNYFKFLASREYIENNPTKVLDTIRTKDTDKKKGEVLTEKEAKKLLNTIRKTSAPSLVERNLCMTYLMMFLGLRVSELVDLKTHQFDFQKKTITVIGKGGKIRKVPIFDNIKKELQDYMKTRSIDSEFFFTAKGHARQLDTRSIRDLIIRAKEKAGIEKEGSCHLLRRTAATYQLESGINIVHTQEHLGHADITTTMKYLNPNKEEIREGIRKNNELNKKLNKIKG